MNSKFSRLVLGLIAIIPFALAGCGAGGGSTSDTGSQNGTVSLMVSDAPLNDWAAIDVKILSIALNPSGGGAPVVVYTAPSPAPMINLVQLDQLGELLGNISVPAGTYVSATLTLSGNPGDVTLITSEEPDTGFAGPASTTIPSNQIQIQGTTGAAGSLTVPLSINFVSNLVVAANSSNALDLEFDLSHPAFIVAHVPPALGTVEWAVNFNGPWVHHHPIRDITRFVLRDLYGSVNSVSADNTSILITKEFPAEPPTNVETAIASSQTVTILADAANGTIFYDLDAKTHGTIFNFSSVSATLDGKFVRVAARYQVNGTLTAVRIWASTSFDKVFQNPEGHVLHVNNNTNVLTVENENGHGVRLQVVDGANPTQFYFRTPASAQSDDTAIGSGTAFLSNVKRGFKVHVLVDPTTVPLPTVVTVDIQIAKFDGKITNSTNSTSGGFDYTRAFPTVIDSYTNFPLNYISSATTNGKDPLNGGSVIGFKWWNFVFPTLVTSNISTGTADDTVTIQDFFNATSDAVNFGGTVGSLPTFGTSSAIWGDPANSNGWSAPWTILVPSPVPLGTVATAFSAGTFTMNANGGANPATVDVSTASGSATLVYQVDRTNGVVTVSPVDITTAGGLSTFTTNMSVGKLVKVAGLPESTGHIKAYVIFYFTGNVMPTS